MAVLSEKGKRGKAGHTVSKRKYKMQLIFKGSEKDLGLGKGVLAEAELTLKATDKEALSAAYWLTLSQKCEEFMKECVEVKLSKL